MQRRCIRQFTLIFFCIFNLDPSILIVCTLSGDLVRYLQDLPELNCYFVVRGCKMCLLFAFLMGSFVPSFSFFRNNLPTVLSRSCNSKFHLTKCDNKNPLNRNCDEILRFSFKHQNPTAQI